MDEGYIKFSSVKVGDSVDKFPSCFEEFNQLRNYCYGLNLIGMYENGIGFGNISLRVKDDRFIISGSQTGNEKVLSKEKYCEIVSFDPDKNEVDYNGSIPPSSETMSHGSVYKSNSAIMFVVHFHNKQIFEYMLKNNYHKTSKEAQFGTPRLATEIELLVKSMKKANGIFVTEGHEEGVIAFGDSIANVKQHIAEIYGLVISKKISL